MEIKIGTLNCQNNKTNRNGGVRENGLDNAEILAKHIEKEGYYCLGTQELTRVFSDKIAQYLNKYKLYGDYRYGNSKLVKSISAIESFNENNSIITNQTVAKEETNLLPWYPYIPSDLVNGLKHRSIMPRIMTTVEIEDPNIGNIFVINTHLDYQIPHLQQNQLQYIKKYISILSKLYPLHPIVLTGDFNMEKGTSYFDEFIKDLDNLGLQRVEVNDKTLAFKFPNKTAIDHIFIPKKWMIEDMGIITDPTLEGITDHKGIYADIKTR